MTGYIHNIISRHLEPGLNISPRLPGLFEPQFSQPGSVPEENNVSKAELKNTHIHNSDPSVHEADRIKSVKSSKTEKASLYNNREDQYQTGEKINYGEKQYTNISASSVTSPTTVNPNIKHDIFSSQTEAKHDGSENKTETNITAIDQPGINTLRQEVNHQLVEESDRIKESFSFIKPQMNELASGEEKIQYMNNTLLVPAPIFSSVLPKENSTASIFNYHEATSVIKVSIGRIEVRANLSAPQPVKTLTEKSSHTKMSLEDYLKKRNSAER